LKKTKQVRKKHIPQRTCVGCRDVLSKRNLVRLVRSPQGVIIDSTGKAAGRGAYLHKNQSCWQKALQGSLAKALKTDLSAEDFEKLNSYMDSLPTGLEN
jgi:predicted RNA-binding protein YlxR (DUF448 family)